MNFDIWDHQVTKSDQISRLRRAARIRVWATVIVTWWAEISKLYNEIFREGVQRVNKQLWRQKVKKLRREKLSGSEMRELRFGRRPVRTNGLMIILCRISRLMVKFRVFTVPVLLQLRYMQWKQGRSSWKVKPSRDGGRGKTKEKVWREMIL